MNVDEVLAWLEERLPEVWSRRTSTWPREWSAENPALGQCVPTALLVRRLLGGTIMQTTVRPPDSLEQIRHYFNRLPGGREVDLTRRQFQEGSEFNVKGLEQEPRRRILPFHAEALKKYALLCRRLGGLAELEEECAELRAGGEPARGGPALEVDEVGVEPLGGVD